MLIVLYCWDENFVCEVSEGRDSDDSGYSQLLLPVVSITSLLHAKYTLSIYDCAILRIQHDMYEYFT